MPHPKRSPSPGRPNLWDTPAFSFLLFLGAALLAFYPCLFQGQAYFANDLFEYYFPIRFFLKAQLLQAHFPLWNPYLLGGQPLFADPNTSMCYPLQYLTLFFPVPYGLSVYFFLHSLVAALGMRFWLRSFGLTETASRMGALLFAFSGFFWWQFISPPILAAFAWSPWWLGCLGEAVKNWSSKWSFLAGLCFAVIFCCGNIQSAINFFYVGSAYFLYLVLGKSKVLGKDGNRPWKKGGMALLFAAWGALPLMAQLIPAHEFFDLSYRNNPTLTYDNFNATFSMPPRSTYRLLFPALGLPPGKTLEEGIVQFDDRDPYKDNPFFGAQGYLGIWVPLLMGMAFLQKDRKGAWFLAAIGLTALATAWGHYFPLHRLECLTLPGMGLSRAPNRMLEIYVLSGAALAAAGFENLRRYLSTQGSSRFPMGAVGIYATVLFAVACLDPGRTWREMLALCLGTAGLMLWRRPGVLKRWGQGIFITTLLLPLLLSVWNGFSTGPASNYDFEKGFPAFSYLKEKGPEQRYLFDTDLTYQSYLGDRIVTQPLPRNVPMDFGVRSTGGNNPLFLQKTYELTRLPASLFVQLMSVKGLVWKHPMQGSKDIAHHSFPGCEVYEPLHPPPYVLSPNRVRVVQDDRQALELMKAPGFDPTVDVVLSEPLPYPITDQLIGKKGEVKYSSLKDDPNDQLFKVVLDKDSLLVFSEIMYPGWKAYLDGTQTRLYTGNLTFRTVFVQAGEHRVEFRFEPLWAKPLFVGLFLWLVSVIGLGLYLWWTRTPPPRKMGHA